MFTNTGKAVISGLFLICMTLTGLVWRTQTDAIDELRASMLKQEERRVSDITLAAKEELAETKLASNVQLDYATKTFNMQLEFKDSLAAINQSIQTNANLYVLLDTEFKADKKNMLSKITQNKNGLDDLKKRVDDLELHK